MFKQIIAHFYTADHPALKKPRSKPDIFKVQHDEPTPPARTQSQQAKAEIMKLMYPSSPHPPQTQDISTPPPSQAKNGSSSPRPRVRYTKSALDVRDEDLKKLTLASILKDDKSARQEKAQ